MKKFFRPTIIPKFLSTASDCFFIIIPTPGNSFELLNVRDVPPDGITNKPQNLYKTIEFGAKQGVETNLSTELNASIQVENTGSFNKVVVYVLLEGEIISKKVKTIHHPDDED